MTNGIRLRGSIAIFAVLALAMAACGGEEATEDTNGATEDTNGATEDTNDDEGDPADFDPVTLTVQTLYGPESWETVPQTNYAAAVEEASNGQITFEFHYAEALVAADEMGDALGDGLIDMAVLYPAYTPAKFPIANWQSQSAMLADPAVPSGLLASAAAQMEWTATEPDFQDEFNREGIHMLAGFQSILMFDLLCNEPVRNLDEAEGKRVRVAGETWAAEAENIGMEPVALAGGEIYEGFQRGIVDCAMIHPTAYMDLGLWDLGQEYTAASFTGWNQYWLTFSKDTWDNLPAEAQQILWDNIPVLMETHYEGYLQNNHEFVTEGEDRGIVFHDMDDEMAQQIQTFHADVLEQLRTDAPEGVSDPSALVDSRVALQGEWADVVEGQLDYENPGEGWAAWVDSNPEGQIDLEPWLNAVRERILEVHRP